MPLHGPAPAGSRRPPRPPSRAPATSASPSTSARPGRYNAITDVPGVEVGHVTLVEGDAVRTGVTAVLPRGRGDDARAAVLRRLLLAERERRDDGHRLARGVGHARGPGAHHQHQRVGVVRDAVIPYAARRWGPQGLAGPLWSLPVVAETWDGRLNDIYGMHVKAEHALPGHRGRARRGRWPRATSAAAPG